jgi:hypothetical protein
LDADLVIPVILARPPSELDVDPRSAHVYPAFSDRESQKRVRKQMLERAVRSGDEPKQVAWLLGLQLVMGVVAANGRELRAIEAGTLESTVRALAAALAVTEKAQPDWHQMDERGADLVVACLDGNAQQQTWDNVARAILNAQQHLAVGGVLAVCTTLTESPGVGLRRLKDGDQRETLARLADDPAPDAQAAAIILKSLEGNRILLQSALRSEQVERLGFGVIEGDAELSRLIGQHHRCLVLESAQFASWEPQ